MKIQPLYDLKEEINRLFIAGSRFSSNDPRIIRLIPVLERLGEKSPVFKKLKQDLEALTKKEDDSSLKLLEIGVLLYSILYTQGDLAEECELESLNLINPNEEKETLASYLRLYPLICALTKNESGRLEIIKNGFLDGLFKDVRTHRYLADAIEDKYSEISSFVCNVIIPHVGEAMIPYIKEKMDVKGKTYDAYRLKILYDFKDESVDHYIKSALEEGSVHVLVEAIKILSDDKDNEDLLLSLTEDRRKEIREAALLALCRQNSEKGTEKAVKIFLTKQFKSAIEALKCINTKEYNEIIFNKVKKAYDDCFTLKGEEKEAIKGTKRALVLDDFQTMLQVLANKDEDYILDFFEEVLSGVEFQKLSKYNASLVSNIKVTIEQILMKNNDDKSFKLVERLCENDKVIKISNNIVSVFFKMASSRFSKEKMYDEFSKHYMNGYIPLSVFNIYSLEGIHYDYYGYNYILPGLDSSKVDKRWVKLLLNGKKSSKKQDFERGKEFFLATYLFDTNEDDQVAAFKKFIDDCIYNKTIPMYFKDMAKKLMEVEGFDVPEMVLKIFERIKPKTYNYQYEILRDEEVLNKFPKHYQERFMALFNETKLDEFFQAASFIHN